MKNKNGAISTMRPSNLSWMLVLCTVACDVVDCVVSAVVDDVVVTVVVVVVDSGAKLGVDGFPFLCRARSTRLANVTEELNENFGENMSFKIWSVSLSKSFSRDRVT